MKTMQYIAMRTINGEELYQIAHADTFSQAVALAEKTKPYERTPGDVVGWTVYKVLATKIRSGKVQ